MFPIVGRTAGGAPVVAGVYRFFETHGVPLDMVFELLKGQGAIPCWMSLYREASEAGMKHSRIISKLEADLSDAYGAAFRDLVVSRLQRLHDVNKL